MILLLKKIAVSVLLPPGLFAVLSVVFSFLVKGRARVLFLLLAASVYSFSLPFVSSRMISAVEYRGGSEDFASCDVIVLLGGGVIEGSGDLSGKDSLSEESVLRTCDAVRLWRKMHKPVIVCGGSVLGSPAEAEIAARYLIDLGVDSRDILLEDRSRTTAENAAYASAIMKQKGFSSPLVVTSSWHCRRAEREFARNGFSPLLYPSGLSGNRTVRAGDFLPSASALRNSSRAAKEMAGAVLY